ncbi:DNA replication protein DnaC [Methanococcus voltae PS]|uniref:DNA replication protein DnaC n=1 Tax=Methanococcus voltae PS TaxID=523842 RepID=A0ABT2EVM4_METVO|nr:hypothetical protein [Methanococcus voltae]MCS3922009.1 DNA replication protein DnaC [Methanococcus voltae PS]
MNLKRAFFGNGRDVARKNGWELTEKSLERSYADGGKECLITGPPGTGKSTLMLRFAMQLMNNEYVIWRGRDTESYHYIENWEEKVLIHHHINDEVDIFKITEDSRVKSDLRKKSYKDIKHLVSNFEKGVLNVVYTPTTYKVSPKLIETIESTNTLIFSDKEKNTKNNNLFWFEFFDYYLTLDYAKWTSIFIDEADDLFPATFKGIAYRILERFTTNFKDYRKSWISLYCGVHNSFDLDYHIVGKFQYYIYLKAASVPNSRDIDKSVIKRLKKGEYLIENGNFGFQSFKKLKVRDYLIRASIKTIKHPEEEQEESKIPISSNHGFKDKVIAKYYQDKDSTQCLAYLQQIYANNEITKRYYYKLIREFFEFLKKEYDIDTSLKELHTCYENKLITTKYMLNLKTKILVN